MDDTNNKQMAPEESTLGGTGGRSSKITGIRESISDKLREAAEAIEQKVDSSSEESHLGRWASHASVWLNRTADYLENIDLEQFNRDVRNQVSRAPGRCLFIAGAAGLA